MTRRLEPRVLAIILFLIVINLISLNAQFARATDTWSIDTQLTWDTQYDWYPSMTNATGGKIWLVWHSFRINPSYAEIFYKVYDPSKVNPWSQDTRLTFSAASDDIDPSVMQAADGKIWVVWVTKRTGQYEVYYKTYDGTSWSPDAPIPTLLPETSKPQQPSILQAANGTIWLFWSSPRLGNDEIFYKTYKGGSWSSDTLLGAISSPSDQDLDPAVTQSSDGKIWLVWTRNFSIFYTVYNGASWTSGAPVTVGTDTATNAHPSVVQASDGSIKVFWDSDRSQSQYDIFYNSYNNGWGSDTQLTTNVEADIMPSAIRASDGKTWVAWASARQINGNTDIYYKTTSPSPVHNVAMFDVSASKNIVTQGRSVDVQVVIQNLGTSSEIVSIDLYANTTRVGSKSGISLGSGKLNATSISWNTSGFALGKYTLKANTTVVAGDANPADNTYVEGVVTVVIHDVMVTNITTSAQQAYQGYTNVFIYVDVKNNGTVRESVTVTVYRNTTIISIQTVYLDPGASSKLTFILVTSSVPYGKYHIIAQANPVMEETNYMNNNMEDGFVTVTIPGDVNGDKKVDVYDLALISAHWSEPPEGPLGYDSTVDIDGDVWIYVSDVEITSLNWGTSW